MTTLSTHVLDTSLGRPAAGLQLVLEQLDASGFRELARARTDADGRAKGLVGRIEPAIYRMTFETAGYFAQRGIKGFYPYVQIVFEITAPDEHYHVPLLLSPFGFSTYRGS